TTDQGKDFDGATLGVNNPVFRQSELLIKRLLRYSVSLPCSLRDHLHNEIGHDEAVQPFAKPKYNSLMIRMRRGRPNDFFAAMYFVFIGAILGMRRSLERRACRRPWQG